ncbi:MAG: SCO family protein [Planctomycetia bacterium]|nr:SCO family protein [Planctomycetia bacterium]
MNHLAVKIWLSVLLLASSVYAGIFVVRNWRTIDESRNSPTNDLHIKPARPLADFRFVERSGKKIQLNELEGKIFVVNFFWANCPMSCLRLNQAVAAIQREFKDTDIQFVSITVEPTVDTPERLKQYADNLNAPADKWWFLNAPLSETQDLGTALKVNVAPTTHTDALVVVDRAGIVRGAYDFQNPVKLSNCKQKLRDLLVEQPVGWKPGGATNGEASATATPSATAGPKGT